MCLENSEDNIFPNTFRSRRGFLTIFYENENKPELEVYDTGMINNIAFLIQRGLMKTLIYMRGGDSLQIEAQLAG